LNWQIPLTVLLGTTVDVSPLLRFHWFQPVFYTVDDPSFPSESPEALGYFVGISTHCGHAMTFKVLTADTNKVILRSQVRPADDPLRPNLRLTDLFDGEPPSRIYVEVQTRPREVWKSFPALTQILVKSNKPVIHQWYLVDTSELVDTPELVGKTFLMPGQQEGTIHRARIVEMIEDHRYSHENSRQHQRFKVSINDNEYDDVMTYGEIIDHINKDSEQEVFWRFKQISSHQGPLLPGHPDYNGSSYNVQVEWENGEITFEPLRYNCCR
jgi:hypothetical protein